jgi:uncharacterized phage infection (PIP) family protein YhgE
MAVIELTKEQIEELTNAAIVDLRPKIVQQAAEQVAYQIKTQIQEVVRAEIQTLVDENFKQQLHEDLAAAKPAILACAGEAAVELTKGLVGALVTQMTKTLGDDYKRRAVLQELIGKY